ncbi:MAG TPA: type II toxin-antitoxin system VapC family toxin [Longimicrobiales bacterium]
MRFFYFDTSALVKVYAYEGYGSDKVRALVKSATLSRPTARIVVCDIALAEAESAIARKERKTEIRRSEATRMIDRLRSDMLDRESSPYQVILSSSVVGEAGQWSRQYNLKGMDAIQFAAALAAMYSTPAGDEFCFVCADDRLCDAARAENMPVDTLQPPRRAPAGRT